MESKFGEKLKELRNEQKLSQRKLASIFNISQPSIARWEKGADEPSYETLIKLAKFFGVRTDYLLGLED